MKRQHTIFALWWALCGFHKKRVGRRYTKLEFLHPVGSTGPILHFGTSGVSNVDTLFFILWWERCEFDKKTCRDTLHQTCVFAYGGICGSHSAFRCIRGMKRQHTILHARLGSVRLDKKSPGTPCAVVVFLHPVGYAGHAVHFGASGVRNGNALLFTSG
jgi:hypothetical protein